MADSHEQPSIRVVVRGIFRRGSCLLVGDCHDPADGEVYYVPPGGGVEFWETAEEALRREIREELGVEIDNVRLHGVMENRFTMADDRAHEIVFLYQAVLRDARLYDVPSFSACESNGEPYTARWLDLETVDTTTPAVYPEGLLDELTRA